MRFFTIEGHKITELIERHQLKKYWVAEHTGVHTTTLRRWLSGKIAKVKEHHVRSLAGVLNADFCQIVSETV